MVVMFVVVFEINGGATRGNSISSLPAVAAGHHPPAGALPAAGLNVVEVTFRAGPNADSIQRIHQGLRGCTSAQVQGFISPTMGGRSRFQTCAIKG